jgi:hypothetical protein
MKTPYRYSVSIGSQWYAVNGEDVVLQSEPYYFYGYVANWKEIGVEDIRNWRMSGFFRGRASSHQFVKSLAKVIRTIYYTYGVQAVKDANYEPAKFHVDRLNTESQSYEADYSSEFDFSSFQDKRDTAQIQLMQGGIEEMIKVNEDVEYEIPVNGSNVKTITIEPIKVRGRSIFVTANDEVTGATNRAAAATDVYMWPQIAFYTEDFYKIVEGVDNKPLVYQEPITPTYITGQQRNELPALGTSVGYLFRATVALTDVNIKLDLPVFLDNKNSSSVDVKMAVYRIAFNTATSNLVTQTAAVTVGGSSSTTHTFSIDHTFDLAADETIHIVLVKDVQMGSGMEWNWEEAVECKVTYQYQTSQFTVKGLTWNEVGNQLISKATGGAATFQSDLLTTAITYKDGIDCRPESLLMLSGESVRGVATPKIRISLKDYLKATDVYFCAGLGVEDDVVRLEKRSYFFKRLKSSGAVNLIANLSSLDDWTIEDAEDLRFSELHIGHSLRENEIGELNGKDEFNGVLKFTSSYTKDKKVLDLVSPVSASTYEMYLTYINYITDDTPNKDNKFDNKVFALQYKYNPVTPTVGTALYPSDISSTYVVSGITDTNRVLNIGLSPKRCLFRHLYWLLSHFYTTGTNTAEYLLSYQTTDRNPNLQARLSTNISIAEASDTYLDEEAARYGQSRLFYPIYILPETVSPVNYKLLWSNNRYGVFTTEIEDVTLEGYPITSKERNEVPQVHEFKLLLTANNTPTSLIR